MCCSILCMIHSIQQCGKGKTGYHIFYTPFISSLHFSTDGRASRSTGCACCSNHSNRQMLPADKHVNGISAMNCQEPSLQSQNILSGCSYTSDYQLSDQQKKPESCIERQSCKTFKATIYQKSTSKGLM